jgi:predicted pyridoxine 5'-phosphate oxidase superfamily flavin-nucleotide-binding protein
VLITTYEELRRLYDRPNKRVVRKCLPRLDQHCRKFISLSPFIVVSTSANGKADASPRGDKRGFVDVLDDHTLLIPDRPGTLSSLRQGADMVASLEPTDACRAIILPSAGGIQADQIGLDAATVEREIENHNKTMLY